MFAFVVFDLVSSVLAKRLAGKNVSEMAYFVSSVAQLSHTVSDSLIPVFGVGKGVRPR